MLENAINTSATFLESLTLDQWGIISGIVIGVIAVAISKYALTIGKRGILPDIEPRYEIKQISQEYVKYHIHEYFLERHKDKYGNMYSHLIVFNGGNGKATNIDVAYNWVVNGRIGGVNNRVIEEEVGLHYYNYLFPGWTDFSVPALDFGSDVFEEAESILIRVRYKDCIGGNHCKCVRFVPIGERRGFYMDPHSHNHCGRIRRCFKTLVHKCSFREDICSTEDITQIPEEEKDKFERYVKERERNEQQSEKDAGDKKK